LQVCTRFSARRERSRSWPRVALAPVTTISLSAGTRAQGRSRTGRASTRCESFDRTPGLCRDTRDRAKALAPTRDCRMASNLQR
jgi:hypothetical protein